MVLNKADLVPEPEAAALACRHLGVAVSAARKRGLRELVAAAEEALGRGRPLMPEYGTEPERTFPRPLSSQ